MMPGKDSQLTASIQTLGIMMQITPTFASCSDCINRMIADLSFSFIYLSAADSIVVLSVCRRVTRIRMITDALGGYCVQTYLRVL